MKLILVLDILKPFLRFFNYGVDAARYFRGSVYCFVLMECVVVELVGPLLIWWPFKAEDRTVKGNKMCEHTHAHCVLYILWRSRVNGGNYSPRRPQSRNSRSFQATDWCRAANRTSATRGHLNYVAVCNIFEAAVDPATFPISLGIWDRGKREMLM